MLEQLHPHLAGGSGPVWILLHQHEVRVVAVQGVDGAMRQVLRLVHGGLIHLESTRAMQVWWREAEDSIKA